MKVGKGTPDYKRQQLAEKFRTTLENAEILASIQDEPIHVFCEEPLALQNGKTTRLLGLAAGALWAQHLGMDVWWHWVDVATWQSMVGVKPNDRTPDRKDKARQFVLVEYGEMAEDWEEDHCDAGCIAIYGERELAKLPDAWKP
jgi:hypothetical protein